MATFRYKRLTPLGNRYDDFEFDSSPAYSLPRALGWTDKTTRLVLIEQDERQLVYDVYGVPAGGTEEKLMGTLIGTTREEQRRRLQ